jgi:hypothetical protein
VSRATTTAAAKASTKPKPKPTPAPPVKRERAIITGAVCDLGKLLCRRLHRTFDVITFDERPFPERPKDVEHAEADLRRMSAQTYAEFDEIVLGGIRAGKGMGSFKSVLTPEQASAIRSAMIEQAWQAYEREQAATPQEPSSASHDPSAKP